MRQHDTWNYLTSTIPTSIYNVLPNGDVDFSNMVDPCAGMVCTKNGKPSGPPAGTIDPIFDPNVAVGAYGWWAGYFPGNVIPADRVSPAGMNTLKNFFPKPNLPGTSNGWFRNFEAHTPENQNNNQIDTRFDQEITSRDRLYAVYHWQSFGYLANDSWYGQPGVVKGSGDADQATNEDMGAQSVSLTYDRVISPTALNELRFGYLFNHQNQYSLLNGTDYSTKYGYGNIAVPGFPATVGFPDIYMADGYLAGGSSWKPYHMADKNYQIGDSYTWTGVPRHEFKFGADLRLKHTHPNFSLFPTGYEYYGSWGYAETSEQAWWGYYYDPLTWGSMPVPDGWNWLGGSDVADMVLGLPLDVYIGLQLTDPHTKSRGLSGYAQDTYKASPRLTLNYGIRYEYEDPWSEAHNNMSNFDLASGNIVLAGRNGIPKGIVKSRAKNFSPRFGFAYTIDPKTVIRGGVAIFYSPENDGRTDFLTRNNPFALQYSLSNWEWNVAPSNPQVWPYQIDTGMKRDTSVNIPSSGYIVPKDLLNGKLESTYAVNPNLNTGTTDSFNLAVERQLSKTTALDVSYVGSVSHHLSYKIGDINADPNQGGDANAKKNYDVRITKDLGVIEYLTDSGMGNYNSLQVKLTRQQTRDLSFLLSYTYSHTLDNGPAPFDAGNNNDMPQDPYNLTAEYASADTDVRHNLVFSGSYNVPLGEGHRWGGNWSTVNSILGGWKFSPIFMMRSGTPVNVILGEDPKSALAGIRPNISGNPNLSRSKRTYMQYFDTSVFSVPVVPQNANYAYGNAGRNLVTGPGYINIDASLSKEFSIENRGRLEVRAETFNGTNSIHYTNPDGSMQSGTFGQILSTYGQRRCQLAAKFTF
jgi:hypothetical protein